MGRRRVREGSGGFRRVQEGCRRVQQVTGVGQTAETLYGVVLIC